MLFSGLFINSFYQEEFIEGTGIWTVVPPALFFPEEFSSVNLYHSSSPFKFMFNGFNDTALFRIEFQCEIIARFPLFSNCHLHIFGKICRN